MFFTDTYSIVQKKVTVLLSTGLAWPSWAGWDRAELFSEPGTNFFAQPCTPNPTGRRGGDSRDPGRFVTETEEARREIIARVKSS